MQRTPEEQAFYDWAAEKDQIIEELETFVVWLEEEIRDLGRDAEETAECACCGRAASARDPESVWVRCVECEECCPNYANRCRVEEMKHPKGGGSL